VQASNNSSRSEVDLTERTLTALKWNYAGIGVKVLAQFLITVVLARMLGPEPFGVYSITVLVIGIGGIIVERGFGSAVIQTGDLSDETVRYAFTRLLFTGLAVSALLSIAAPSIAGVFRYPPLRTAIYGSAFYLMLYAISVVPGALLRRDLDMKSFQTAQIGAYLVAYPVVGIGGALRGWGPWSLIGALIVQLVVFVVIAYAHTRHPIRPLFRLSGDKLACFGNAVLATNLLNWAIENLDNLIVGQIYGMRALGLYAVSYNLVRTPTDHVVTTAQNVLFPAASRVQENVRGLQTAYLAAVSALELVLCPVFLGIASAAPTVIQGIYGSKWTGAENLLVPLALAMPVHASMTGSGLLWARDQVATELRVQTGSLLVFVAGLLIASRVSLAAISWAVFAVYVLRASWLTSKILDSIQLSWRVFFGALRGGLLLGGVTAGTLCVTNVALASRGMNSSNRLCLLTSVGLLTLAVIPVCVRSVLSAELRGVLERATSRSSGFVRSIMQLSMRA
jgi:lipopolysaccharide exporter